MLARNDKRGKAKLERALSRTNEALANLPDLFEMYIYAKQSEGTAKGTITNKRIAVNKFLQFIEDNGYQNVPLRALSVQNRPGIYFLFAVQPRQTRKAYSAPVQ